MTASPGDLLAAIAAHGLPGARPWAIAEPLAEGTFIALLDHVTAERLTGHLVSAIETGAFPVTEGQDERSVGRHETALASDLVLERLLVETSRRFTGAGIPHRALKGPVVARTAYPDPALRSFGDVDVLVQANRFDDAVALLAAECGEPRFDEPRPRFTERFGKGVCVVTGQGLEIDLHRVFSSGPFGLAIDDRDLFTDMEPVVIAGSEIPAPGATLRFLHACYHAALGGPRTRLTAYRDVAQIEATTDLDLDAALDLAARWRGRAVLARAADQVRERLAADFSGPFFRWADRYQPDRFERAALRVYSTGHVTYSAQAAAGLWGVRGTRRRVAYAWALLFPSGNYVRDREGTYLRRLGHAISLGRPRRRPR